MDTTERIILLALLAFVAVWLGVELTAPEPEPEPEVYLIQPKLEPGGFNIMDEKKGMVD